MPARSLVAGAAVLRLVVYAAIVVYFGYMINKISVTLSKIAAILEQMRINGACRQ